MGPKAVVVDEREKTGGLRLKKMVAGMWRSGVIFALERIAENDDEPERRIGEDGKI